jgi:hypothetical protein
MTQLLLSGLALDSLRSFDYHHLFQLTEFPFIAEFIYLLNPILSQFLPLLMVRSDAGTGGGSSCKPGVRSFATSTHRGV